MDPVLERVSYFRERPHSIGLKIIIIYFELVISNFIIGNIEQFFHLYYINDNSRTNTSECRRLNIEANFTSKN